MDGGQGVGGMIERFGIAAALALASPVLAAPPPKPKLIIVISVDQFSADLFAQHRGGFTGGLKRLASGVVFGSGYQSHAATETCPGHSTITSGMHPSATGIVGNTVWDAAQSKTVYCIDDGVTPVAGMTVTRSPAVLKAPTLGAWLKAADPASKVWAVAGKDRAAIPMGGARADGEFWWNEVSGGFTTFLPPGTTAADRLKPVAAFNTALLNGWKTRPPAWSLHDKSCAAQFGPMTYDGVTVDHRVPPPGWTVPPRGAAFADDPAFQAWFRASPEFDRIVLELAGRVIAEQQLGRGPTTDMIAIGLSATDYVGHRFGSQGPEMCDQLAWLDARLGLFLAKVDALKIPYIVALTADHGSIDAAERAAQRGIPAVRIDAGRVFDEVNAAIKAQFKLDYQPLAGEASQIIVSDFGEPDPVLHERIVAATVAMLRTRPEVAAVFTRKELLTAKAPRGKSPDSWSLAEIFAASTDAERSGEIAVAWREFATPFRIDASRPYIAGHGSPWNYDRRVPILFWWPGAAGFEQPLAVETVDIAPTLAAVAGIKAPPVDGRCLDLDAGAGDSCGVK